MHWNTKGGVAECFGVRELSSLVPEDLAVDRLKVDRVWVVDAGFYTGTIQPGSHVIPAAAPDSVQVIDRAGGGVAGRRRDQVIEVRQECVILGRDLPSTLIPSVQTFQLYSADGSLYRVQSRGETYPGVEILASFFSAAVSETPDRVSDRLIIGYDHASVASNSHVL